MLVVLLGRVCDEDHMYSGFALLLMGGSEHKKEFQKMIASPFTNVQRATTSTSTSSTSTRLCSSRRIVPSRQEATPKTRTLLRATSSASSSSVDSAVDLLKAAAKTKSVPPRQVFAALRDLEKASLQDPSWPEIVGGRVRADSADARALRVAHAHAHALLLSLALSCSLTRARRSFVLQASPGNRWRLVFTTGTKQVREALKGKEGGGNYFPLTAAQRWDASTGTIENGIFLGLIAALTFSGGYCLPACLAPAAVRPL